MTFDSDICMCIPAGTGRRNDVGMTSMRRHIDIYFDVMSPLGYVETNLYANIVDADQHV